MYRVLFVILLLLMPHPVSAQESRRIVGEWFDGNKKIGLKEEPADFHPYFFYANCSEQKETIGYFDIPFDNFAALMADDKYMQFRSRLGASALEMWVKSITFQEASQFSWQPTVILTRELLEQWTAEGSLTFDVGARTKEGFLTSKSYQMPDRNRVVAARTFLAECFGAVSPPTRTR